MKQILRIEVNDTVFGAIAREAHTSNVSVNDYCRMLIKEGLDNDAFSENENPEQMTMTLPEGGEIEEAPKEQPSDVTRPPFPKKKEEHVPAPVGNQQKTTGSWVDPKVANKPNSWLF